MGFGWEFSGSPSVRFTQTVFRVRLRQLLPATYLSPPTPDKGQRGSSSEESSQRSWSSNSKISIHSSKACIAARALFFTALTQCHAGFGFQRAGEQHIWHPSLYTHSSVAGSFLSKRSGESIRATSLNVLSAYSGLYFGTSQHLSSRLQQATIMLGRFNSFHSALACSRERYATLRGSRNDAP